MLRRDQRGVAAPSLLVMLSVITVAVAGIALVATNDRPDAERKVQLTARETPTTAAPTASATPTAKPKPKKPAFQRAKTYVEVYNNSGIKGLAASVAATLGDAGWQVVGTDNWQGTVPATTVYYPPRLEAAAKQLALDLGIDRVHPASDPMRMDRLTVILTGAL